MMEELEFPLNPAFYKSGSANKSVAVKDTKAMKETFLELCRQQNIPFNKADALLYRLQAQKDIFRIFCVIFNALVRNSKPSVEAENLIEKIFKGTNHL